MFDINDYRTMLVIIDTVAQRGGFVGQELSTVGNIRDKLFDIVNNAKQLETSTNEVNDNE